MTNDELTAAVRAGTLSYTDAMAQAAANAGMSQIDYASSSEGFRVITNLAYADQHKADYYTDTTTPITPFGGYTVNAAGDLQKPAPGTTIHYIQDVINPVYGGGLDTTIGPSNGGRGDGAPTIGGSNLPGVVTNVTPAVVTPAVITPAVITPSPVVTPAAITPAVVSPAPAVGGFGSGATPFASFFSNPVLVAVAAAVVVLALRR